MSSVQPTPNITTPEGLNAKCNFSMRLTQKYLRSTQKCFLKQSELISGAVSDVCKLHGFTQPSASSGFCTLGCAQMRVLNSCHSLLIGALLLSLLLSIKSQYLTVCRVCSGYPVPIFMLHLISVVLIGSSLCSKTCSFLNAS